MSTMTKDVLLCVKRRPVAVFGLCGLVHRRNARIDPNEFAGTSRASNWALGQKQIAVRHQVLMLRFSHTKVGWNITVMGACNSSPPATLCERQACNDQET